MDAVSIRSAYKRYARIYDAVFGNLLAGGRHSTVRWINRRSGLRVLEVGVGTGISLSDYRKDHRVTGIDLSTDMLRVAKERVDRERLDHVEGLIEMDAGKLGFADGSFDLVVAMYVMTVVPDPKGTMAELERVCKPGGDILIVNHFAADKPGIRRTVENWMAPFSKALGWRPDFTLETLMAGSNLKVEAMETVGLLNLFSLLHCRRPATS